MEAPATMKSIFTITTEPAGEFYEALLDHCFTCCKYALLVVRPTISLSSRGEEALAALGSALVNKSKQSEWPGTRLHGHEADVYLYNYNLKCKTILLRSTRALYDWQQPELPEDLCLLKSKSEPYLISIAHERDSYFKISARCAKMG